MSNIAYTHCGMGNYVRALQLYKDVYIKRKNIFGEEHPQTIITKSNIAYCYCDLGKYSDALRIFHEVYEKLKNVLGDDHSETIKVKYSISILCHSMS